MYFRNLWSFTKEVIATVRRRRLVAFATVSTSFIALLVLSATIVAAVNLSAFSTKLRSSAEVTVFLKKDVDERERAAFEAWIAAAPYVADYDYISPASALSELASELGQDAALIEAAGGNPIPPSFRIKATAPEKARQLVSRLRGRREVFRLVYASEATARLLSLSRVLNFAGILLSLLLSVACVTIIHNAMAVAIEARRKDIRIMHLVGADPRLIRLPYLIHGVLYGTVASVLASVVTFLAYVPVAAALSDAIPILPLAPPGRVVSTAMPATILCGALFGLVASSMCVSRHLSDGGTARSAQTPRGGVTGTVKFAVALIALVVFLTGAVVVRADAGVLDDIGRAERIGESIAASSKSIGALTSELRRGRRSLSALSGQITRLDKRVSQAEAKKARLARRVSGQLLAYYASRRGSSIGGLVTLGSMDHALIAGERLRFVLSSERSLFEQARQNVSELSASRERLSLIKQKARAQQERLADARQELAARIKRQRKELASLVASITRSIAIYPRARDLKVAIYGAEGFIFPVAAAHRYSNDWHNQRVGHLHQGTDIFAAHGAPLLSVVSGSVRLGNNKLGGTTVHLNGDDGTMYYYAHLSGYAPRIRSGQRVGAGELVGFVGQSGNAAGTPPHLHFEIHPGGRSAVNPFPTLSRTDVLLFGAE